MFFLLSFSNLQKSTRTSFWNQNTPKSFQNPPEMDPRGPQKQYFPGFLEFFISMPLSAIIAFLLVQVLQVRFKTLQKNTWGRTPDKNGPDIALLQLFPENVSKWVPGGGPGEGPRTTFSQPFSVLSPTGSPGGPWVAQMLPKGLKTRPRDCQNEAPGLPKRSRMCHRPHHFLTWALPQGYEIRIEGTVAGTPQANR
jgi:hypothetical protein